MKNLSTALIFFFLSSILLVVPTQASQLADRLNGMILLQVEESGEAWYVYPKTSSRKYLGRPIDAFNAMREFGLGISNENLAKIPVKTGYDNPESGLNVTPDPIFTNRYLGYIFLQTEANGEAWYIYPQDGHRYYLGRPADAFRIMRELGLGISTADLNDIPEYTESNLPYSINLEMEFTAQAPFGIWDPPHDEACEEASFMMAANYYGLESGISNPQIADKNILTLTSYVESEGYKIDLELEEAKIIYESYYDLPAKILRKFDLNTVKMELVAGHPIVMPVAGREIGNPYFTPPGPIYHFLVIKGYTENDKIITHDPGTKRGADYIYDFDVLYNANHEWNDGNVYQGDRGIMVMLNSNE